MFMDKKQTLPEHDGSKEGEGSGEDAKFAKKLQTPSWNLD